MRLRGFTRNGTQAVVNTDQTQYEIIKRERVRKRTTNALASEVKHQQRQIDELTSLVKELLKQR